MLPMPPPLNSSGLVPARALGPLMPSSVHNCLQRQQWQLNVNVNLMPSALETVNRLAVLMTHALALNGNWQAPVLQLLEAADVCSAPLQAMHRRMRRLKRSRRRLDASGGGSGGKAAIVLQLHLHITGRISKEYVDRSHTRGGRVILLWDYK